MSAVYRRGQGCIEVVVDQVEFGANSNVDKTRSHGARLDPDLMARLNRMRVTVREDKGSEVVP